MEKIILLETSLAYSHLEVFKLQFTSGEYDMVVFNEDEQWCKIYEIKYSKDIHHHQCIHLLDKQKCHDTSFYYGKIIGKYVIYRGPTQTNIQDDDTINYINVEEYLTH